MKSKLADNLFLANNHSDSVIRFRIIDAPTRLGLLPVLDAFGCNDATEIEELDRQQLNSRNFRITTDSGQTLIRQSLSPHSPDRARLENVVMLHCHSSGVATPEPIRTINGSDYHSLNTADGRRVYFTAASFIAGNHYCGSVEELISAAQSVAKLGRALASFPGVQEISAIFTFLTANYSLGLLESLRRLATDDSSLAIQFHEYSELIAESVYETSSMLPLEHLNSQLLHGDLHPHNFLMTENGVAAVLDFGEMRFGPRLEDLAYSLYRLVRQAIVYERLGAHEELRAYVLQLKKIFLENYTGLSPIPDEEQALIAPMIKHIALKKIFHVLSSHYLHGIGRWDGDFEKHLTALYEADYFA